MASRMVITKTDCCSVSRPTFQLTVETFGVNNIPPKVSDSVQAHMDKTNHCSRNEPVDENKKRIRDFPRGFRNERKKCVESDPAGVPNSDVTLKPFVGGRGVGIELYFS